MRRWAGWSILLLVFGAALFGWGLWRGGHAHLLCVPALAGAVWCAGRWEREIERQG